MLYITDAMQLSGKRKILCCLPMHSHSSWLSSLLSRMLPSADSAKLRCLSTGCLWPRAGCVMRWPAQPELLVSSPLSRALHTADLAFQDADIPRLVLPLARERLWLSSDVGQPRRAPVLCICLCTF